MRVLSVMLLLVVAARFAVSQETPPPAPTQAESGSDPAAPVDITPETLKPLPEDEGPMNIWRLGRLLKKHFPEAEIQGQGGVWRIELPEGGEVAPLVEGNEEAGPGAGDRLPAIVLVLTDERADRMRIMMPIRSFDPENEEDLRLALIALHANYDRALDARYAIQDGVLWSAFIHPLSSLTKRDLASAIRQVQGLRANTGTTYSSGELFFGPGGQDAPQPPADPSSDESRV